MIPISQLQFARKYPFTSPAKRAVRQLAPDLNAIDSAHFQAALDWIQVLGSSSPQVKRAFVENHVRQKDLSYSEFLSRDVVVFPLLKIILSQIRRPVLYERFASLMGDLSFEYLSNEKDKISSLLEMSRELGVKMDADVVDTTPVFRIPLSSYLSFPLKDAQLHLVNQSVDHGIVCLSTNAASRWLAEGVHSLILRSLPVDVRGLPPVFVEWSTQAQVRLSAQQVQESKSLTSGVVLTAFPPCMEKLYGEITSGVNIPHMARFDLATFLINIRMPHEDIVGVFAKASNYDERITRYHLDNLSGKSSGKQYSMPACSKVREHGLCVSRTCDVSHPLQFYRREVDRPTEESSEKTSEENSSH
jgi:DNA primase large subunit